MAQIQKYNIIIAEDESLVLLGLKAFLHQLGHNVIGEAYSGAEAITCCSSLSPDLLIMDIKMPDLDGIQALEQINAARKYPLPCIFITAYSDNDLINRAKKAGAYEYLIKPISVDTLNASINITMHQYSEQIKILTERDKAISDLKNRKIIERAKGILMDSFDMKEKQAMEYLQKKARSSQKKITFVAESIIRMEETLNGK